jgi:hypothetical protein
MKNATFNIPSAISQSFFADQKGEEVELSERDIIYFYYLIFLYREELLYKKRNILLNNGDKYSRNETVNYDSVEIELNEFQKYGVVSHHKYEDIRSSINKLPELSIIANMFGKNQNMSKGEEIRVVDTFSWDKTLLTIKFTDDFVNLIVHTEKYFMKVDLYYLLNLNGRKAMLLYLLLKDYSRIKKKHLRKDELEALIGKIPQKNVFDGIIKQINIETDIMISYMASGIRKKKYKFTINKKKSKPSENKNKPKPTVNKEEINVEVMEKAKQQLMLTKKVPVHPLI